MDKEMDAMVRINDAFNLLEDADTRARVIRWAIDKFSPKQSVCIQDQPSHADILPVNSEGEMPGIATLTDAGEFRLTVRDVKAKNTNDAALRLAHIAIYAHQKLTQQQATSSRKVLVPILKQWRAYTANTRVFLSRNKGIVRSGDALSLDAHATRDAEKYINEIRDDTIVGAWRP